MAQQNEVLVAAVGKLARAGESAGFTVEELIELLNTGVTVETLLNLISLRLELPESEVATPQIGEARSKGSEKWL